MLAMDSDRADRVGHRIAEIVHVDPDRDLVRPSPTGAFDLVRGILILYPQRDSNPCCRLESAKLCISRSLRRSFVIGRILLSLGQTCNRNRLIACINSHSFVGACVLHAPSIWI